MTEIDLDRLEALIDKAYTHVCDIASGRDRWTMRIPAQEHSDSDLVLSTALAGAQKLLEEVRQLREQLDEARAENRALNDAVEPFGECSPDCDCADHQRVCLCHVTGAEAREWIRREEARADLLEAQRDQVLAHLDEITKMSTIPGGDLEAAMRWRPADTFDTIRAIFSVSRTPDRQDEEI